MTGFLAFLYSTFTFQFSCLILYWFLLKSNVNTFRGFSKRRLSFQHLLWSSDFCYLFKHRLSFIVGFKYVKLLMNSCFYAVLNDWKNGDWTWKGVNETCVSHLINKRHGSRILQQTIWPWNHTSHKNIYFYEFVANVLFDNIGILIFDLHGGC